MKIKLLPFEEALKKSKKHYNAHHISTDICCIGIFKSHWKDNEILEVQKDNDGYYLAEDGYFYCECCCEVIED